MNTDYYVYERFRKDDNTCFYVGQGRKKRYSTFTRNKLHDAIATKYGFYTIIYKDNLTQEQSCQLETERIKYYISCGYGINNKKQYDIDDTKFLTNTTYGGEKGFSDAGKLNSQYHISPKQRMGEHYDKWKEKTVQRLSAQTGDKNPNYHNDTLKKKLQQNPQLKKIYYSRKNEQNGRAVKVKLYKQDIYVDTFNTIGKACEYIQQTLQLHTSVTNMRSNLVIRSKQGKTYRGYKIVVI